LEAISESLQNLQPGITPGQCDQKWRNLQQQYKKYIDNSTKTGRGRVSKPEFFDEIEEIIGSSHTVNPQHIIDTEQSTTSLILDTSAVSTVEEEGGHRSVEKSKKKMKPSSSIERLEQKIDLLIAEQTATRQQFDQQFDAMLKMFQKQHEERQSTMRLMVKAISRKCKRASDSDSN